MQDFVEDDAYSKPDIDPEEVYRVAFADIGYAGLHEAGSPTNSMSNEEIRELVKECVLKGEPYQWLPDGAIN